MRSEHWSTKYIGRPYVRGEYDCVSLVVDVVKELRGVEVPLPDIRSWRRWSEEGAERYLSPFAESVPVRRADDGDLVLMRVRGRRRDIGTHVGAFIAGYGLVLHCSEQAGVRAERISEMVPAYGGSRFELVGYYRWSF